MDSNAANIRKVVMSISIMLFFNGIYLGGIQLVVADVAKEFGMTLSGIGVLASVQQVAAVFLPPIVGVLADRIGKKKVILIFAAIGGTGCLFSFVSKGIIAYLIGALLIGAGYSICESVGSAALSGLDSEKGAQYINLSQGIDSLGAVISPLILPLMMKSFGMGWRTLFLICCVSCFTLAGVISKVSFPAQSDVSERTEERTHIRTNYFSSRLFTCVFVAMILYIGMEQGISYFAESLFEIELNRTEFAGFAISAFWAGMTLSRFVYSLRQRKVFLSLMGFFVASAVALAGVAISNCALFSVILCGAVGFAYGPIWSILVALAAEAFPDAAAGATGLMSSGIAIGGLVFPVIVGMMSDILSIRIAIVFLAGLATVGVALIAIGRPRKKAA